MSFPTAIVAEDEPSQRAELLRLLEALWPDLRILATCEDGLSALEALNSQQPQIAFLDVRMPGISGLDVARAASGRSHVVFVTAYDEYAVTAFEAGAADYMLKPVNEERLQRTVMRLRQRLANQAKADLSHILDLLDSQYQLRQRSELKWVTASLGDTVKMFAIEEVLFFQAKDKYVRVVTAADEAVIRMPLRDLVSQLNPDLFWQIHRSVIVRVSAIDRVHKDALGHHYARIKGRLEKLPISAACQARFRSM